MKTKEELNAIKEEVKALNVKLAELTDEELAQVFGGATIFTPEKDKSQKEFNIYNIDERKEFEPNFK